MVLHELGLKLAGALSKLNQTSSVDDELINGVVKEIVGALLAADVNVKLVGQLRKQVTDRIKLEGAEGVNMGRLVERAVIESLVGLLDPGHEPFKMKKGKPSVVMFVGLQGAGKTTTVGKYAHFYKKKKFSVGMVCADTFRAGAFDQLKQNAIRVHVPYYGDYTETDPVAIAKQGVDFFRSERTDVIIVDTSGRHKQEAALFEEMEAVAAAIQPDEVIFVMDSSIGQAAYAQAEAFKASVPVGSCIITKLDGHAKGGGALSAVAATGSPITFVGVGEHFEDLERFEAPSFISKMLGRGDVKGLMEKLTDTIDKDAQEAMMERISKGKNFSLRDMYDQFAQIQQLGPLDKVMGMLPGGMGQMLGGMGGGDSGDRIKKFLCIMDSMTTAELDGKANFDKEPTRKVRVAQGAGVSPMDVDMLLKAYKQFAGVVQKMGKSGLMKGGDAHLQQQLARNPGAVMQQLQKSFDPKMLQQMGGAGGMMNMMKQMTGMDPSALQGMMGGAGGGLGNLMNMFGGGGAGAAGAGAGGKKTVRVRR